MAKERALTKAELARKETFELKKAEFEAQGYRFHPLTIGVVAANLGALAFALPIVVLLGIGFFLLHPEGNAEFGIVHALIVVPLFIILTVVHELIHGLVWSLFAENGWKAVSIGVIWRYLTPYCTCNEPLHRRAYIVGALAPTVVLGLAPVLAAYATESLALLAIGLLMIFGGGGDLTIVIKMLRFKPDGSEVRYLDHPYECGLVAFVR